MNAYALCIHLHCNNVLYIMCGWFWFNNNLIKDLNLFYKFYINYNKINTTQAHSMKAKNYS